MGKKNKHILFITLILDIIVITIFILLAYILSFDKKEKSYLINFNRDLINEHSQLETDKSFTLSTSKDGNNYELTFSTSSMTAEIGMYPNPEFIYKAKDSSSNNVDIKIENKSKNMKNPKIKIYRLIDSNIVLLDESQYSKNITGVACFYSINDIEEVCIYSLELTYLA